MFVPDSLDADRVRAIADKLANRFVTVNLAVGRDGSERVVEVGDGQVSDRPASIGPAAFVDHVCFS